ncbi:MAG: hypothetical protein M1831_005468 [Alyxoria varia]|nr:MAG: hypothetical protein M1831_005468 [Alyxoria varia]
MPSQEPLSVRQPMIKMDSAPILSHSKLEIAPHLAYEAQTPPPRNNNSNNNNNNNKPARSRGSWAIDITEAAAQARKTNPSNDSQLRQPRQAPPIAPLAPRDARPAEDLWDLAHFLRETGPSSSSSSSTARPTLNLTNTTGKPTRVNSTQKKLVKRVFRLSSSNSSSNDKIPPTGEHSSQKKSLADFKPANASQRVSKDGKRYLHIMVPEEANFELSGASSVNQSQTSTARVSRDGGQRTDATMSKTSHESAGNTRARPLQKHAERPDAEISNSDIRSTRLARNKDSSHNGVSSDGKHKPRLRGADAITSEERSRQSFDRSVSRESGTKHAMDARTPLSSNPTSNNTKPGPAPSKPLPTVPDADSPAAQGESNQFPKSSGFSRDGRRSAGVPVVSLNRSNSERSSNQGVRRTPYDATPRALSAMDTRNPVDNIIAKRHQQNLSVDSAANMGAFTVRNQTRTNQSGSASSRPTSSRGTSSNEMTGGRPSTQQERKEKARARKLRDLQRHRPSIDEVVERRTKGKANQRTTDGQHHRMCISPIMTTASISPQKGTKTHKKPPQLNLQQDLHASSLSHRLPLSRHTPHALSPIQSAPNEQRMSTDSLKPLASPLSFKDRTPPGFDHAHKHLALQDSQRDRRSYGDKNLPELIAPADTHRKSLLGDRGRSLPASPGLLYHLQNQSQGSVESQWATRLENLERENRLLEAALIAVLRTSGRMNHCPCGGSTFDQIPNLSDKQRGQSSKDSGVAPDQIPPEDRVAEPGQEATWLHPQSKTWANRYGKKFSTASSLVSAGGVSATSAAEEQTRKNGQTLSALDLYMASRAGQRDPMVNGGGAGIRSSTGTLPTATATEL